MEDTEQLGYLEHAGEALELLRRETMPDDPAMRALDAAWGDDWPTLEEIIAAVRTAEGKLRRGEV